MGPSLKFGTKVLLIFRALSNMIGVGRGVVIYMHLHPQAADLLETDNDLQHTMNHMASDKYH